MKTADLSKWIRAGVVFFAICLALKYLLPVLLPFVLGGLIALAAEPAVGFLTRRAGLRRGLAAGLGVSAVLVFLAGLACLMGALAVKELGQLADFLPDARQSVQNGIGVLRDTAVDLTDRLPLGIRDSARSVVTELFRGGTAMTERVTRKTGQKLTTLLGKVPDGVLGVGTALLAGYMISARLPRLRQNLVKRLPPSWQERYLPALSHSRKILGGWLRAQGKLAMSTAGLLVVGFALLQVPYGFLWAFPVALVDAVPVLGTGVILIPWALVNFLQGKTFQGVGFLVLWAAAVVLRQVLEPKWVGKYLNLDPLATLLLFYLGYRFWGIGGMILAPLLAAAVRQLPGSAAQKE